MFFFESSLLITKQTLKLTYITLEKHCVNICCNICKIKQINFNLIAEESFLHLNWEFVLNRALVSLVNYINDCRVFQEEFWSQRKDIFSELVHVNWPLFSRTCLFAIEFYKGKDVSIPSWKNITLAVALTKTFFSSPYSIFISLSCRMYSCTIVQFQCLCKILFPIFTHKLNSSFTQLWCWI
jgi:hypothetical protein